MNQLLSVNPSRRILNIAVWLSLSLFYAFYYCLTEAKLTFDLYLPLTKAGLHIDSDFLLWFVWCGVVSLVSTMMVVKTDRSAYGWKWFLDLTLVTILTVVVMAVLTVIVDFSQFLRDAEAKEVLVAIYTVFLISGLIANLSMAAIVLVVARK
jgi:hypothetical protein